MGKARRHGLTVQSMKGNIMRVRNTDSGYTVGAMALATRVNGLRTKFAESAPTPGLTEGSIKANG